MPSLVLRANDWKWPSYLVPRKLKPYPTHHPPKLDPQREILFFYQQMSIETHKLIGTIFIYCLINYQTTEPELLIATICDQSPNWQSL